ncbi:MAG: 4-phosphopantetheinyl transferase superfamily protein [Mucilaginibacter sp.]|nr:4-phosphopantetheinyl transferase superfamily protein [Mucilaginibacter sp.]
MNSTGNDVVSLNAIDIARTKQQRFYSKILAASESILYSQYQTDITFENFVWLLWSVKESAYKYLQRNNPVLVFSPTRCIVTQLEIPAEYQEANPSICVLEGSGFDNQPVLKSIVTVGSETLYSRSIITRDLIFSVVNNDNNFDSTGWGIKLIDNASSDSQSTEIRMFLLEKLKNELRLPELHVHKNSHGCPILLNRAREIDIPVSLAHHSNWIAYSYQLAGVVA